MSDQALTLLSRRENAKREVVAVLEEALEMAKRGELASVVVVGDLFDSAQSMLKSSATPDYRKLVGSLMQVVHDLLVRT